MYLPLKFRKRMYGRMRYTQDFIKELVPKYVKMNKLIFRMTLSWNNVIAYSFYLFFLVWSFVSLELAGRLVWKPNSTPDHTNDWSASGKIQYGERIIFWLTILHGVFFQIFAAYSLYKTWDAGKIKDGKGDHSSDERKTASKMFWWYLGCTCVMEILAIWSFISNPVFLVWGERSFGHTSFLTNTILTHTTYLIITLIFAFLNSVYYDDGWGIHEVSQKQRLYSYNVLKMTKTEEKNSMKIIIFAIFIIFAFFAVGSVTVPLIYHGIDFFSRGKYNKKFEGGFIGVAVFFTIVYFASLAYFEWYIQKYKHSYPFLNKEQMENYNNHMEQIENYNNRMKVRNNRRQTFNDINRVKEQVKLILKDIVENIEIHGWIVFTMIIFKVVVAEMMIIISLIQGIHYIYRSPLTKTYLEATFGFMQTLYFLIVFFIGIVIFIDSRRTFESMFENANKVDYESRGDDYESTEQLE